MERIPWDQETLKANSLGKVAGQNGHPDDGLEIENKIREFVAQNLLFSENGFPYANDASFLANGVIDSLGVLELVTFATREFNLQIETSEVTPENFDSVNRFAAFIRRKRILPTEAAHAGA